MMTWQDLHHSELTVPQLYALLKLRSEVFVVEQQCVYQDVDGDDLVGENRHLLGWRDGELLAYARILKSEEEFAELLSHLEATLVASGQSICAGNVEIAPYQIGSQIACTATFCPYRSFCQFDRFQGNNYRQLETLKDEEIFARLKAEVKPDELDN